MRHAVPVGLAVVALMLLLGAPFLGVKWGFPDDRVLPTSASAHQVGDELRDEFADDSATAVTVVVPDATGLDSGRLRRATQPIWPGCRTSSACPRRQADGSAFLTVYSTAPLFSDGSEAQLDRLHAVAGPGGREVLFTGTAQVNRDSVDAITSRLPLVLGLIAVIMFVVLFLLTGSVVIPLKALVLNVLSLTAAFGAMVWIFQDGHLGGLGTTTTGTLVANIPVSVVLHRLRPVDGLRGVPRLAHPRVLAARRRGRAPTTTRAWRSASRAPAESSPPRRW